MLSIHPSRKLFPNSMVPQTLKIVPSSSLQDDNNKDSKLYQHLFCKNCKRNTKHCVHLARVRERHEREHNGAVLHSRYARGVTSYNGQTYRAAILCIFNSVLRGWRYARWRSDGTNSQFARSMLGGSIFFRWFCTNVSLICISIPTFVHDLTFEGIPCAGMSLEFSV